MRFVINVEGYMIIPNSFCNILAAFNLLYFSFRLIFKIFIFLKCVWGLLNSAALLDSTIISFLFLLLFEQPK